MTSLVEGRPAAGRIVTFGMGVGIVLLLLATGVGLTVAPGLARDHVFSHLLLGVPMLLLFGAVAAVWEPRPRSEVIIRGTLLVLLWIATVATLLEAIGGAGSTSSILGQTLSGSLLFMIS